MTSLLHHIAVSNRLEQIPTDTQAIQYYTPNQYVIVNNLRIEHGLKLK